MKRGAVLLHVLFGVAAGAAAFVHWRRGGETARIPVFRVERGGFSHAIEAEGTLRAAENTTLAVPTSPEGPFKIAWLADDGAFLKAGDVAVRFDTADLEKRLADGRDDAASSDRKLEKVNYESGARLGNLALDAKQAALEVDAAKRFAPREMGVFSRNQVVESEIDGELAKEKESHVCDSRLTAQDLAQTEVDLLALERKKATIKIEDAEAGLKATELKAPHDGIVLMERDWRGNPFRPGQQVWNGQPIARIPKLERMEAEVYMLEADAGGLAIGKAVELRVEAHPERVWRGKLKRVDTVARPRGRNLPVQYFGATVELDETDMNVMKSGARVVATVKLEERAEALAVPRQAVFDRDGSKIVWRKGALGFEAVAVTLGPSGLGRVIVEAGLAEGDELALSDPLAGSPGRPTPGAKPSEARPLAARAAGSGP